MEPNLAGSIYVRSSIKLLHLVPFDQETWPLLLKIEHMVKLHVFGNNSKTVNNIRNMTWVKMISTETRIDAILFGSFEITSIRLYTPLRNPLHGTQCAQPD
jgi:hypothetical protein